MGLSYKNDVTQQYKQNLYNVVVDVSGWDQVAIQAVTPLAAPISVYGSNDGSTWNTATNFVPIQATNLATNSAGTTLATAGLYTVPVNAQYLKLQGLDVYKLILFESKNG